MLKINLSRKLVYEATKTREKFGKRARIRERGKPKGRDIFFEFQCTMVAVESGKAAENLPERRRGNCEGVWGK